MEAERVSIWFADGKGNLDSLTLAISEKTQQQNNMYLERLLAGIARYSSMEGAVVNSTNVWTHVELWEEIQKYPEMYNFRPPEGLKHRGTSILCVPMTNGKEVVGVIQAIQKLTSNAFTDADQQIVEAVSLEVAFTISRHISELCLRKLVKSRDDVPLDVIEYYLTGVLSVLFVYVCMCVIKYLCTVCVFCGCFFGFYVSMSMSMYVGRCIPICHTVKQPTWP